MKTKEEIIHIKNHIQNIALTAIENNNHWGLLEMATGTGKSKIPIDYIKKYDIDDDIALLVPTEKLRDENWKAEFSKWEAEKYWDKVQRFCYASASKIKGKKFRLLICDEGHNLTRRSMKFFENNEVKALIVLTATVPSDSNKLEIFRELGIKTVYTLTLEDAERLGIIKPFTINVVRVPINDKIKNVQVGKYMFTEKERLDFLDKKVEISNPYDDMKPNYLITAAERKNYQMSLLGRAQFIYNLKSKQEAAEFLLRAYIPKELKTLIFTASIPIAENLCDYAYHSKDKKKSKENFDKFANNEITRLSCVNGLNEGHNIDQVDVALIEQANSNEINLIQRIGRILRHEEDKVGIVWLVVSADTQDEVWAKNALSNFSSSRINVYDLKDLQNHYVTKFKQENGIKY